MRLLVLTKRQYMNKDLIDDRFGRFREIPLALAQKGHKVQGLCLSYSDKQEGLFHDGSVTWRSINATPLLFPGLLRFILEARTLSKKADVIWACSDSIYGIIGQMLSARFGIPLVFDLYDNFEYFLMARLPGIKQFYRYVVKNCDAVTCVSQPLAGLVGSYGRKENIVILENAVRNDLFIPLSKKESRQILNLPQNVRLIGTAGALVHNRGIETLFEAFDFLKEKFNNVHLALAGPRNIKIPQDAKIHDLGILPLEKVPLLLNSLDVAVICNRDNGFGRYCFPQKTVEIMACDVPLVAARVGSMAELFKDNPECLFTPDSSGDLSSVIEHRLQHRSTGYTQVSSWKAAAERLGNVFDKVTHIVNYKP